nr:hypothetical protein [Tanacetum cinerariifolium]
MIVQPQPPAEEEEDEVEVPNAPTPLSPTTAPSPPSQEPIPTPQQAQPPLPSSPPQEPPTTTFESWGRIEAIDADEDITLVDAETRVNLSTEIQERIDDVSADTKETLIKMKAEKARLLDEEIAKRLHDEEVEQAAAREKQEKDDLEKAKVLQKQYEDKLENIDWNTVAEQIQEKHLDNIRKYQTINGFEKSLPKFVCFWTSQFLMWIRHGELMTICCVVFKPTLKDPLFQQDDFKSNKTS